MTPVRTVIRRALLPAAVIAVLAGAAAPPACEPPPPVGPTNVATIQGDSLTVTAGLYSADPRFVANDRGDVTAYPGRHMSAGVGWTTSQARVDAIADGAGDPQVTVIATAHNDAALDFGARDGWTWANHGEYDTTVLAAREAVLVLPGVGPGIDVAHPGHRQEILDARASILAIADAHPDNVCAVVDMQATIDQAAAEGVPMIGPDGIHFQVPPGHQDASDPARRYIDTVDEGLLSSACAP